MFKIVVPLLGVAAAAGGTGYGYLSSVEKTRDIGGKDLDLANLQGQTLKFYDFIRRPETGKKDGNQTKFPFELSEDFKNNYEDYKSLSNPKYGDEFLKFQNGVRTFQEKQCNGLSDAIKACEVLKSQTGPITQIYSDELAAHKTSDGKIGINDYARSKITLNIIPR